MTVPSFRARPGARDRPHRRDRPHPRPGPDPVDHPGPARGQGRVGPASRRPGAEIEDLLVGAGLSQVINYSFGDDKWPDRLRLEPDDRRRMAVTITNPLSGDQAVMRTMLLPGLLETARQQRVRARG